MIWVINTNTNACRIYNYIKHPPQLILFKEITHPENKLKNIDLTSDKPGHYKTRDPSRGSYSPRHQAKENEIDKFSREIALELNKERKDKDYEKIILIAPPHMMGLLLKHFNKHVRELISNQITKDLFHYTESELLSFLRDKAQYADESFI